MEHRALENCFDNLVADWSQGEDLRPGPIGSHQAACNSRLPGLGYRHGTEQNNPTALGAVVTVVDALAEGCVVDVVKPQALKVNVPNTTTAVEMVNKRKPRRIP